MAITKATRVADFGSGIGTEGAIIKVDNTNERIGIGTTNPQTTLQVGTNVTVYGNSGIVSATSFSGDGSNLTNAGSTLSPGAGDQRVVVTSKTSGAMSSVATDADLSWNSTTNTLSSGNLSIGGTVTSEDVTNVDSLGIVTARTGIKVLAGGINAAGVVTATSFSGDGSNLTGVESGVSNFVASGTISNGATVILKDDGTVGIVTTTTSPTPSAGTPVVFESANVSYPACAYDPDNGKVIIAYKDYANSNYGTAIVGTVSGTSISFGGAVVYETAYVEHISCVYDTGNDKVVIAYRDRGNSDHGTAIVGTVSGTSISFGGAVVYHANATNMVVMVYDPDEGKVVIAYNNASATDASAIVGTVSGTSISFGSATEFTSAATGQMGITYDTTNDKVVIIFSDGNNSSKGSGIVGTVSGTSISFGSATAYSTSYVGGQPAIYDPVNEKVLVAFRDGSDSNKGYAVVGTVSGTSISFGTPVMFHDYAVGGMYEMALTYDPDTGKSFLSFFDSNNSYYGTTMIGTISGTTCGFDAGVAWNSSNTGDMSSIYDTSNDKLVIAYRDSGNSAYGTAVVFGATSQVTNLTTENYIGIAGEAIANAATGKVTVLGGVNSGQSGLTTAKKYYVGQTGILTTTADTPSVVAGTSISNTKLLVR